MIRTGKIQREETARQRAGKKDEGLYSLCSSIFRPLCFTEKQGNQDMGNCAPWSGT